MTNETLANHEDKQKADRGAPLLFAGENLARTDVTMGLSIKNAEVERMVRELAARRGVGMTEALRELLAEEEARVAAARRAERQARYEAVMPIAAWVAAMPDISDMTDDEILGHDENGIPSR